MYYILGRALGLCFCDVNGGRWPGDKARLAQLARARLFDGNSVEPDRRAGSFEFGISRRHCSNLVYIFFPQFLISISSCI